MQGTTHSRRIYRMNEKEKKPDASEYCVRNTFPIISSVTSTS